MKRRYRERLADGHQDVLFVHLQGAYETVAARLAGRSGHYMPLSLLQSQYDALEEPGADESAIVVSIDFPIEAIVEKVIAELGSRLRGSDN